MKLNQRKHNNESEIVEMNPRSTVLQKYKNHIQHVIQDSEISFDSIQTPGWTSLVNTEQSKSTHLHQNNKLSNPNPQGQILNRLNSLPKIVTQTVQYNNIRIHPQSAKNKNIFVYSSVKTSQKNKIETPKSRYSQKGSNTSRKSLKENQKEYNSLKKNQNGPSFNKFVNRFNKNKPEISYSVQKPQNQNLKISHKRVQSVRSQPSQNLKQKIQQRLSLGNPRKAPQNISFQRNIFTQPNQDTIQQRNKHTNTNFFSLNDKPKSTKDHKNQYFNRYMNKLSLRNKNQNSVKIFKKPNVSEVGKEQGKNLSKMDLIKDKQNTPKRFNTITVHDYLYQDHIKLESKKKVQRMIEESYNKATKLTFTPFISKKSNILADSKFQRESIEGRKPQNQKHKLDCCFKKTEKKLVKPLKQSIYKMQEQVSLKQKQRMLETIEKQPLSRLFAFLSNDSQQIDDKTIQENIEKLPLSLIEILEPFLTKVYKKEKFTYKKFVGIFSPTQSQQTKQFQGLKARKLALINQSERFFRVFQLRKRQEQNLVKEKQVSLIR